MATRLAQSIEQKRRCSVVGCERIHLARGFCSAHYQRMLNSGSIGDPIKEPIREWGRGKPAPQALHLPTSEADLAYLAGILDGEGSISTLRPGPGGTKRQRRWAVTISSTHMPLIEWLEAFGRTVSRGSHNPLGKLPCMAWTVVSFRDALHLLESLRPYLRIKAERADQAIQDLRMWIEEAEE